jgi:tRNA(fMet)-specific endonuclease VapC
MRRFLFDTGIASDYMNRRNQVYDRARDEVRRGNVIGICVPVLAELFYGAENSASRDRTIQQIRLSIPSWRIWPFTNDAAEEYGRLAAELQRIGRPMQQIDIMIAAIAMTLGNTTVVSADSDLAAVPGLSVENWATP